MLNIQGSFFYSKHLFMLLVIVPVTIIIGLLLSHGYILIVITICFLGCICIVLKNLENIFLLWLLISPLVMSDSFSYLIIETHPILTFDRIFIGIIFISILIQFLLKIRKPLPINKFEIVMMILFLIIVSSIILDSENIFRGARVFVDGFLYPFIIYLLAKQLITDDKHFFKFINIFLIISIYLSLIGLFEYFTKIDVFPTKAGLPIYSQWLRVNGPYVNDVGFAINLTLCFFIVLYKYTIEYLKRNKSIYRIVFYTAILCLVSISITFTFLRAAWLSSICGLFTWIALRRKGYLKLMIFIPLIFLTIFLSSNFIASSDIYKRRITNIDTIQSRFMIYRQAISYFNQNPFLGIGFENYYCRTKNMAISSYTHNTFLSFLTETGILGFVTVLMIVFIIFKQAYKYYAKSIYQLDKEFSIVFFCILICFFMPWLSQESGYYPEVNKLFFSILGVAIGRSVRLNIAK